MELSREQAADIFLAATTIALGVAIGNPVLASLITSIGANLATTLIQTGWTGFHKRLLGGSGALNHDLQKALARSFRRAFAHLEQAWWQTPRGNQVRRSDPEVARIITAAFQMLQEDADKFCTPDRLGRASGNEQVRQLLYADEAAVRRALSHSLSAYLYGHDPQLVAFVESHLVSELTFWFGEELKADNPESNRAWRAFQRLLLEGMQATLGEVRAGQQEIARVVAELEAWAGRMEARLPEQREPTGQEALERTLAAARDQLLQAIAAESGQTRAVLSAGLEQLARQMHEEVAGLRLELAAQRPELLPLPEPARPPEVPGFVGREAERTHYAGQLASAHLVLITGMAGVGKTALAAVLADQVGPAGKTFWHSFHDGEGAAVLLWRLAAWMAWAGRDDPWRMLQSGGHAPPEVLFAYLLLQLRDQGLLLCLDDLHLVDEDPRLAHMVERLAEAARAGDLSLLITSRTTPSFAQAVPPSSLAGLGLADARLLLSQRGLELPAELAAALHTRTEGNAQFLTLAADALRGGADPAGFIARLSEAANVEQYLLAEVDGGLDEEERAVMGAMALLLGYPGTRDAIEAVLDRGGVLRTLGELVRRHLLSAHESAAGREYGQHAIVQAFYYDLLGRRERQAMHLRAGDFYEKDEADPFKAALHLERAGEYERAARLATADIAALVNRGQARGLRQLLERLAERALEPASQAAVGIARGRLCTLLGEEQAAEASYRRALAVLAGLPDAPAVRALRGRAAWGMGDLLEYEKPQEALEWYRRGLDGLAGADALLEADLYLKLGSARIATGKYDAARRAVKKGLALLPPGMSHLRAGGLLNLGVSYGVRGDFKRGRPYFLQALEISEQQHDSWMMLRVWHELGIELETAGSWAGAVEQYRQALETATRLGSTRDQTALELALGIVHTKQGDLETAQTHLATCLEMAHRHETREYQVAGLSSLADLQIRRGAWDAAAALLAEAEQTALELSERQSQLPEIYRGWAQVHLVGGQVLLALAAAEKAVALARELGALAEEGSGLRLRAQSLLAAGRREEALAEFAQSLVLLEGHDPYEAARTKAAWGRALLAGTERERGAVLLEEAEEAFRKLGAQGELAGAESEK